VKLFEYAALEDLTLDTGVTVSLSGSSWAALMLAVATALDTDLWLMNGGSVDELDEILSAAQSSLMAFAEGGGMAGLPWFALATALHFYAARNPVYGYYVANYYVLNYVYTDNVNTPANLTWFRAYLTPGIYRLNVWHSTGNNHGKFAVSVSGLGDLGSKDCYSPATVYIVLTSFDFTVADSGAYSFEVNRILKNPSSGGSYLIFSAFSIRERAAEEE